MTEFVTNAEMIARSAMATINPALVDAYGHLIGFLALNPGAASKMKGKAAPEIGTEAYIQAQALSFCASRRPRAPQPPLRCQMKWCRSFLKTTSKFHPPTLRVLKKNIC